MAARMKQLSLIPKNQLGPIGTKAGAKAFGGDLQIGKRKVARPLATNRPIHLVLKSTKAKGSLCFLNHQSHLDRTIKHLSKKWGVSIRKTAWLGNHVHLIIQIGSRFQYQGWIRELTASIVRILFTRTGFPRAGIGGSKNDQIESAGGEKLKSFFDHRPFTRVVDWGKDYKNMVEYIVLNQMEVFGLRKYKISARPLAMPSSSG
jgi:REP element-mobilizing transposase RayT